MAHPFSFSTSRSQEKRISAGQSQPVLAAVGEAMRRQETDFGNKSDEEAIDELVSLGTLYASAITSFSARLQSKTRKIEELNGKVEELYRLNVESKRRIAELEQQKKSLKTLLTASVRLPNPLDKEDMMMYEELKHLNEEARSLKFL
ncbi:hypothetical protein [Streptomyces plicatus]|uniref:hypothetical protein n=1 Tax=Streptomyces plicatus TaxID=1922 RepID=UPI00187555DC|nr:hypothetical protein [Streptomyces plicatus]GGZ92406.1 hypothetical protein GCM10010301_73390 [Streptomyces plicatus]